MKLVSLILVLAASNLYSQDLKIGIRTQKTAGMYWENGITAQYSFANFKPGQFHVGFDFITSRLGTAFNSNALKQESYLVSALWYFHNEKSFRFYTKLNTGFFHADLEEDIFKELSHNAFLLSPEIGLSYDFMNLPLVVNLGAGYNISTVSEGKSPGTLQPLFYNLIIYYKIF